VDETVEEAKMDDETVEMAEDGAEDTVDDTVVEPTVYTDRRQLAPQLTDASPAQGMLQSASGALVLRESESPQ
jgi:hypothetical protein